jgi:hypothetical protein
MARSNRNPGKAKRDVAMLCLLLDLKFTCQRIADLCYLDVKGILSGVFQGIYLNSRSGMHAPRAIKCHKKTARAIQEWVQELNAIFGWEYQVWRCTCAAILGACAPTKHLGQRSRFCFPAAFRRCKAATTKPTQARRRVQSFLFVKKSDWNQSKQRSHFTDDPRGRR